MPKIRHREPGPATGGDRGDYNGDPSVRLRAVASSHDPAALTRALSDTSPDVARAAIRRLVEIEPAAAGPAFRAVLLDADVSIVGDLAKALRDLPNPEMTVDLACSALADEGYTHRLAGAVTLGLLGDANARAALCRALDDSIAGVRAAALQALRRLGPDRAAVEKATGLLADPSAQVRVAAVSLVAGKHPRSAELLSSMVSDEDLQVRCELARHLARLTDQAARGLLTDRDEGVRCQAARCASSDHVTLLARLLSHDGHPDVRRAAAQALGSIGGQSAVEALVPGIEDHDALVRSSVLHALERALTRRDAITRLTGELSSARATRRRASLYALARFGDRDRVVLVWRLADDPDLDVRFALVDTASAFLSEPDPLLMYMRTDPNVEVREAAERRLAGRRR